MDHPNHLVARLLEQPRFRIDHSVFATCVAISVVDLEDPHANVPASGNHFWDRLGVWTLSPRSPSTSFMDPSDIIISRRNGARLYT